MYWNISTILSKKLSTKRSITYTSPSFRERSKAIGVLLSPHIYFTHSTRNTNPCVHTVIARPNLESGLFVIHFFQGRICGDASLTRPLKCKRNPKENPYEVWSRNSAPSITGGTCNICSNICNICSNICNICSNICCNQNPRWNQKPCIPPRLHTTFTYNYQISAFHRINTKPYS